ncbi:hypothetical protein [Burkholderia latens]|uniref:hypothetical protein n=1 Tax=Burkholderia latens TaxID=488446 RepID=UPI001AEABA87|nr:hypothetical protein [Burkholderia latens]QTO46378.1 hypothetical protein J8I85_18215 [Burkholderia latens]
MKEPILSREEVRAIFTAHGFTIKEGQTDLKQYVYDAAAALESAILEKLCVEPIYQIGDGNELWRDVKKDEFDSAHHARIVYALNRSKS